jgi:uncharacterized protein (DUF433 family)
MNMQCFKIKKMNWKEHIHSDADILLGKPVIKGTRISVALILELYKDGWTKETILESYPNLTEMDLSAVFDYFSECIRYELFFPLPKVT